MEETQNNAQMDSTYKELEEQLLQSGNKLIDPPSSVDEILLLLNQVESCLSKVEQSPSKSMQDALSPLLKALIADKLLRHLDVDVKVAVASCISEITRITAPDAPYDDDQMKDVFRLIVSSFENLHDKSSLSYKKRTSILETVAKVRSCVVMLDLECDALILEMFQHFFKTIREDHPESVFSSIETIMVLVLEESEDISLELLSPILASVKKDNEEILPIARKLGEMVLRSCATRLKPYILQAVNILHISLDDYSSVVASICQDISGNLEQNDACATSDHVVKCISEQEPVVESAQIVNENANEAKPQLDDTNGERSPKAVMSNGIAQAGEDEALVESKSPKKEDNNYASVLSKGNYLSGNEKNNDLDIKYVDNKEQKLKQGTKQRGKKSCSLKFTVRSNLVNGKEAVEKNDSKSRLKEFPSSPNEDDVAEAAGPSENGNEINTKISSLKASDNESDAFVSPPPSENNHDEIRSKGRMRTKKKNSSVKEATAEDVSKKVSEGTHDSEVKPEKPSVRKGLGNCNDVKTTPVLGVVKKKKGKTEERNKGGGGSSSMQLDDRKKKGTRKGNSEKGLAKSSAEDVDEEMPSPKTSSKSTKDEHLEETPKTNLKRKRTPGKEKESGITKYDESLIGKRVKVWWPDDEMFYEGVIESFDPSTKKHKVLYIDGDVEILNLKKEKLEIIEDDADPNSEEGIHQTSPDATADMPPKKKGKADTGESKKEGKKDPSAKSGGATSSKSKSASGKSSHKSKPVGNSEDEIGRKSKDQSLKSGGKSIDAVQKGKSKNTDNSRMSKSKDDDVSTPKPSAKSKLETSKAGKSKQEKPKIASSSKTKSSKSVRSNTNGSGKVKSGVLKIKDSESWNSNDSEEEVEETKVKTSSRAGSEVKSGKKEVEETKAKTSSKAGSEVKSGKKEVEEMKGKTSSKAGSEVKSGKKEVEETKAKTSSKAGSEVKSGKKDVEEMKGKTSSKAGSEVKNGRKRGRN